MTDFVQQLMMNGIRLQSYCTENGARAIQWIRDEPWLEHYCAFEERLCKDYDFRFWFIVGWTLLTLFIAWKTWRLTVKST